MLCFPVVFPIADNADRAALGVGPADGAGRGAKVLGAVPAAMVADPGVARVGLEAMAVARDACNRETMDIYSTKDFF